MGITIPTPTRDKGTGEPITIRQNPQARCDILSFAAFLYIPIRGNPMTRRLFTLFLTLLFVIPLASCKPAHTVIADPNAEWDVLTAPPSQTSAVDPASKTAYNYLTGLYDMAQDRVGMRPFCISVNNIDASWPQKGTSYADVIVEMETEGGITRLMCMYTDVRGINYIGSVRSLRDQFIEAVYPVDPIIIHIGTSIYADTALAQHGMESIDGNNYSSVVFTDYSRSGYATEHTKFTSGERVQQAAEALDFNLNSRMKYTSYFNYAKPEEVVTPASGDASRVTFRFSTATYDGDFRYDESTGTYYKYQRNRAQLDAGDAGGVQLNFKNVLVLFAEITTIPNAKGLVSAEYVDGGEGFYFSNGRYDAFTWEKPDYESLFLMTREDGTDVTLNAGKTMLCIVRNTYRSTLNITQ